MEKYSRWRDPSSGLHPFLPTQSRIPIEDVNIIWKIKIYILGPLFAILKIPFIIILFLWIIFVSIFSFLIPFSKFRRYFLIFTRSIWCRVLLFLLGFYWIPTRLMKIQQKTRGLKETSFGSNIKPGDIIISNHLSFIEILYLSFRFSPIFSAVPNIWKDSPPEGIAKKRNFLEALLDSITDPIVTEKECIPIRELIKLAEKQNCPLVIFPEGTTSNGKTLLACVPVLNGIAKEKNIHQRIKIIGFKFEYEDFNPAFTVGNFILYFFRLCCQLHNKLEVRYLSSQEIPLFENFENNHLDPISAWTDSLYNDLANILRVRRATMNAKDKLEFKNYWYNYFKNYKKE